MKKLLLLIFVVLLFSNCNKIRDNISVTQIKWVYVDIEKIIDKDTTYYHYFGRMNERILNKIDSVDNYDNLFMLTDIRYIDDYDNVVIYEDEYESGTMFFRIKDVVHIEVLKEDPIMYYESEADSVNVE